MKRAVLSAAAFMALAPRAYAQNERKDLSLTVYNQNIALVRDVRSVELKAGRSRLDFTDVAATVEPASVRLGPLSGQGEFSVLEQNYEYDLVSSDKLLYKYLDRDIRVATKDDNIYEGRLASYDGAQLVLSKADGGVLMINRENLRNLEFPRLPDGLVARPTLSWELKSGRGGRRDLELSYIAGGVGWQADYVAAVSEDDRTLSLNGWVTVANNSGTSFEDARLKLMAGDVRREEPPPINELYMQRAGSMKAAADEGFAEKPFFEYHMYTLAGRTTLKSSQSKQISLLEAPAVKVSKTYSYEGAAGRWYHYDNWNRTPSAKKVAVRLEFRNSASAGLGAPLPKGRVRVYKKDSDGSPQFIGEDSLDHTPADAEVSLLVGDAFDVTGERKVSSHQTISSNYFRDSYEVALKNAKKEAVTVKVIERLYGDWKITSNSHPFGKKDSGTAEFSVTVPAGGQARLTYTAETRIN